MAHADVQQNLPLTEATFLVLLSLTPEPKHGYAIMKDVQALSKERVSLSTGTLYGVLKRLLEQGWIERLDDGDPQPGESGRSRKVYTLTNLGQRVLDAEVLRLRALIGAARLRAAGKGA